MDKNGVTFQVDAPQNEFNGEYRVNLLGRHQVTNALLAIAIGAELGLIAGEIQRGLMNCPPPKMRLQFWEANGVRVLDDAYNANADSPSPRWKHCVICHFKADAWRCSATWASSVPIARWRTRKSAGARQN
ncbi:MAG: hypothetical protein WDN00_14585 [Limisphaerales bacterium]